MSELAVPRVAITALAVASTLALAAPGAWAQQVVHLPDEPGQVSTRLHKFREVARELALSGREQAVVKARLAEIVKVLRTHAIFNPPKGIHAEFVSTLAAPRECTQPPCRRSRVAHQVSVQLYQIFRQGGKVLAPRSSARGIIFTANRLDRVGEPVEGELKDDLGRPLLKEPRRVATFAGVPLLEQNLLLLVRTRRPLFLPVTREQYLRARLRALAQEPEADRHPIKTLRDKLQAELARMRPADRAGEAWVGEARNLSGLVAPGTEDAHRVVIHNPAFLDPRLPRTAIQLLTGEVTILFGSDEGLVRPLTYADPSVGTADIRTSELLRTFDFQKLVALVDAR